MIVANGKEKHLNRHWSFCGEHFQILVLNVEKREKRKGKKVLCYDIQEIDKNLD